MPHFKGNDRKQYFKAYFLVHRPIKSFTRTETHIQLPDYCKYIVKNDINLHFICVCFFNTFT